MPMAHSMLRECIGPEPRSCLWSGSPSKPQGSCPAVSFSPANLVLREVSSVIEASTVGGEFPGGLTQYCLWLRKERPGASEKLRSLGDGDEGRGHLRLLSGTILIPEHLPRPGWG